MKVEEKRKALKLRSQGFSYREILEKVNVSRGTLSLWLRDYILTEKQIQRLKSLGDQARERTGITKKKNLNRIRKKIYDDYHPFYTDPFYMLGLGIYMGEGARYNLNTTSLSNTSHKILFIFKKWLKKYFFKDGFQMYPYLHLYADIDINKAKEWWSKKLKIKIEKFKKPIIAVSCASKGKRKNILKYGTCNLRLGGKGNWKVRIKIQKAMDFASVM